MEDRTPGEIFTYFIKLDKLKIKSQQNTGQSTIWDKLKMQRLCAACSHLSFFLTQLLDFEELGHVGEVLLVGLGHLLLCGLRVHDLQALRTRA